MPKIYERQCKQCNKEYRGRGKIFCSHKCRSVYTKGIPNIKNRIMKTCDTCGKEYFGQNKRFCSTSCFIDKHPRRLYRAPMILCNNYDWGYFLGCLYGDGTIHGILPYITISTINQEMIKKLGSIHNIHGNGSRHYFVSDKIIRYSYPAFGDLILPYFWKDKIINIKNFSNKDTAKGFLCGLFDTDGCVYVQTENSSRVIISQKKELDKIKKLFDYVGIESYIIGDSVRIQRKNERQKLENVFRGSCARVTRIDSPNRGIFKKDLIGGGSVMGTFRLD